MLDSTFEFRLSAAGRQELAALADAVGVSQADVVRISLRRMAAEHLRKAKRDAAPAMPAVMPASPTSLATMSLPELLALRDELALQRSPSPEASRQYDEVNQQIIIREMRSAPR